MTESAKPERGTLLVTGGGRGIGRAVAELAAQRNWAVAVNYRQNATAADAVVQAISQSGARALAIQAMCHLKRMWCVFSTWPSSAWARLPPS